MKIGELSRRTGTSVRMLRYYEAEGLLAPMRMENGYRDYGPMEEEIVRRIQLLGSAGLTLPTIRRFLPCVRSDNPIFKPCADLRRTLARQMELIDSRIGELAKIRVALAGLVAAADPARQNSLSHQ